MNTYEILKRDYEKLEATIERVRGSIKCPDSVGGTHRFDGDGQCKDCCNYATDMIGRALRGLIAINPEGQEKEDG